MRRAIGAALAAALLLSVPTIARSATGLSMSGHSAGGPGYYIRAEDPVLGPCHVTDDYEYDSWAGTLAPGESFTTGLWYCGPADATVLPGYLNEESDEDFSFTLTGRGQLAVSFTLTTPDQGTTAIPVLTMPDRYTHLHGCAYAAQRERYDATNTVYYQRGYLWLTVTNTGQRTARDVALSTYMALEGSPMVRANC